MSPRAAITRIDSSAAAVRNVTSATGNPPATKAAANGSASSRIIKNDDGDEPCGAELVEN